MYISKTFYFAQNAMIFTAFAALFYASYQSVGRDAYDTEGLTRIIEQEVTGKTKSLTHDQSAMLIDLFELTPEDLAKPVILTKK